jgi:SAM-dependent methyltransferase
LVNDALYRADLAYIQAVGFGAAARGAAREIVRRLHAAAIPIRRVVDIGCGAGPLTQALTAEGFAVTGIDPSAELLVFARLAAPEGHFVQASAYEVELPPCEAVLAVGEPLTYHAPETDADGLIQRFFERAAAILPAGGLLIFDVIETGGPVLNGRFWTSGPDWAVMSETREDPSARRLVREIETFRRDGDLYRRGREVHHVRLFDRRELCDRLAACGFAVETAQAYGEYALPLRRRAFFATRIT